MRFMVLYIVGTYHNADIILKMEVLYKCLKRRTSTTAADSQLKPTVVQNMEGFQDMREEGDGAGIVVFVENTTINLGTTFGGSIVNG